MNEEWYNDQVRYAKDVAWVRSYLMNIYNMTYCHMQRPNYEAWLNQIVSSYQTLLDGKDKTFGRFLLDLPHVPGEVLNLLRDLCLDANR